MRGDRIQVVDKFGQRFELDADPDETVADVVERHGLPRHAVVTWVDGEIRPEEQVVVGEVDDLRVKSYRNYDYFNKIRDMETDETAADAPVFSKELLEVDRGRATKRVTEMGPKTFVDYLDGKFVENIRLHNLIEDGDKIALGFSGGTDSTTLLALFMENEDRLPDFELYPVTIADVPDEGDVDLEYTRAVAEYYGLSDNHVIVPAQRTEELFGMRQGPKEVMRNLSRTAEDGMYAVYAGHHVIRRMIESADDEIEATKFTLGLERISFMATVMSLYMTGHPIAGVESRTLGDKEYIYPMFNISKKETEVYHHLVLEDIVDVSESTTHSIIHNLASDNRAMMMYLCDVMSDTWPGISDYLYQGYRNINRRYGIDYNFFECENCGATTLRPPEADELSGTCRTCGLLTTHELVDSA